MKFDGGADRRVFVLSVALGAALVGLGACADILNIEDRTLEDSGLSPDAGAFNSDAADNGAPGDAGSGNRFPGADGSAGPEGGSGGPPPFACLADAGSADLCLMVTGLDNPYQVVSDAYRIYWVEYGDYNGGVGSVRACAVGGCSGQPTIYAANQLYPQGIAVDGVNVYWSTHSNLPEAGTTYDGGIWSCPIGGCPAGGPALLASAVKPDAVFTDGTYVYWTDPSPRGPNTVSRVNIMTRALTVLYDGGGNSIPEDVAGIVADAKNVYVEDFATNLFQIPFDGGPPVEVEPATTPKSNSYGIAIDSTNVYYGQETQVWAYDKAANSAKPLAGGLRQPYSLALDPLADAVYWTDWGSGAALADGTIGKVGIEGAGAVTLQSNLATPFSLTVSGQYVYWLSSGTLVSTSNTSTVSTMPYTGGLWRTSK